MTTEGVLPPAVDLDDPSENWESVRPNSVSVELGHLYFREFGDDPKGAIVRLLRGVKPWWDAILAMEQEMHKEKIRVDGKRAGRPPTLSTCLLIDDYFLPEGGSIPDYGKILVAVGEASDELELPVHFLMREAACAQGNYQFASSAQAAPQRQDWRPAEDFLNRVKEVPRRGQARYRPSFSPPLGGRVSGSVDEVSGNWLSNGRRTPVPGVQVQAMQAPVRVGRQDGLAADGWQKPEEFGARNHSVFLDIEVYDTPASSGAGGSDGRDVRYSCASLAAVWQALRLGELRFGNVLPLPLPVSAFEPAGIASWSDAPPLVELCPGGTFAAERTVTLLHPRFVPTEHAVVTLLGLFDRQGSVAAVDRRPLAERVVHVFDSRISALGES